MENPLLTTLATGGRFACGEVAIYLWVDRGVIRSCRIHGDFFTPSTWTILSKD